MEHRKKIAVLRFEGPRFTDHGLDVDVLPELIAYKRLLQETAKEIWRRRNPRRRRLPKNFDAGITLKFFELQSGSTAVPLFREVPIGQAPLPLFDHELDEAAILLKETITAASSQVSAPGQLPSSVIPLFDQLGQTLRADECILVSAGIQSTAARYDHRTKEVILTWASQSYSDAVELIGEVRGTDLDGQKFSLRLPDGRKIPGRFQPDQEPLILEALGDHLSRRLQIIGIGQFSPIDGTLEQIVRVNQVDLLPSEHEVTVKAPLGQEVESRSVDQLTSEVPVWEQIAQLGASIPTESWESVPSDFAENIDKYLYGGKDTH
jgi:hypothetical protein